MTEEQYEHLHTLHCGRFLSFMAKTEYFITQILIEYYNSGPKNITASLQKIYSQEYTAFDIKKKEFFEIIKSQYPEFIKINPTLFADIDRLSNLRNLIAHSPIISPKNLKSIKIHTLNYLIIGFQRVKAPRIEVTYAKFYFNKSENSLVKFYYLNKKLELVMLKILPKGSNLSYAMKGKALKELE